MNLKFSILELSLLLFLSPTLLIGGADPIFENVKTEADAYKAYYQCMKKVNQKYGDGPFTESQYEYYNDAAESCYRALQYALKWSVQEEESNKAETGEDQIGLGDSETSDLSFRPVVFGSGDDIQLNLDEE